MVQIWVKITFLGIWQIMVIFSRHAFPWYTSEIMTFFQIRLFFTTFWLMEVKVLAIFGLNLPFATMDMSSLKHGTNLYFHDINQKINMNIKLDYFGHNFGQRNSKYWPNCYQNYLFGNIFTNNCNFQLQLGKYWYFHRWYHK